MFISKLVKSMIIFYKLTTSIIFLCFIVFGRFLYNKNQLLLFFTIPYFANINMTSAILNQNGAVI